MRERHREREKERDVERKLERQIERERGGRKMVKNALQYGFLSETGSVLKSSILNERKERAGCREAV